jgi:hypothetical protein
MYISKNVIITVFWDGMPCSLVLTFKRTCFLHLHGRNIVSRAGKSSASNWKRMLKWRSEPFLKKVGLQFRNGSFMNGKKGRNVKEGGDDKVEE